VTKGSGICGRKGKRRAKRSGICGRKGKREAEGLHVAGERAQKASKKAEERFSSRKDGGPACGGMVSG
jgi:hypothetical protein